MQITSSAATTANAATAANNSNENSSTDFETFLTLLTAQMKNQDPLKPMDSTEFVAQLASFSSVEQQIKTNDYLKDLVGLFSNDSATGLAEWIGKEVSHTGAKSFSSDAIDVNVTTPSGAESTYLLVRDSANQIVRRQQFAPSENTVEWDGKMDDGTTAPSGAYKFEVESYQGGEIMETRPASVFELVTEARREAGGTVLVFPDGTTMNADDATSLRLADSSTS